MKIDEFIKEIEELLNELKWYADTPNEQDYNGEYPPPMEWEQGDVNLLLSYIEQLENKNKENSLLLIEFQDMEQRIEQLENNRDKAIEYINKTVFNEKGYINFCYELEKILKGDSE